MDERSVTEQIYALQAMVSELGSEIQHLKFKIEDLYKELNIKPKTFNQELGFNNYQ